ncbi:hypothetical protein AVEN_59043-1, partial [Araneus ventricosus]
PSPPDHGSRRDRHSQRQHSCRAPASRAPCESGPSWQRVPGHELHATEQTAM